ncbi:MAG TPA: TorF family putative porin [Bauldia sp.]|nr:TorF family putative porin [Bauldia sp.]
MRGTIFSGAAAAALCLAGPALADDMFDIAFGATVTNDYVSRGISQTDGDPAIQGYAELDYGIAYLGVWASNVDFGADDTELDFSIGIRPETDNAAFDLGWVQYVYADGIGPTYGEAYVLAEYYATDSLTVGGNLYVAPDYSQMGGAAAFAEGTLDYALPNGFGVSGGLGYQGFEGGLGLPDYWTWNAGGYWTNDTLTVDLRYIDSDLSEDECAHLMSASACGARFMASLSVDSSLSALSGK